MNEEDTVTPNLHDWLSRARDATTPEARASSVAEAVALAAKVHDWRAVLAGVTSLADYDRRAIATFAERTLEAARHERAVWGFRDVAAVRAGALADADGARSALDAGVAAFLVPSPESPWAGDTARGYEWALLGEGFATVLGDESGRRRCLEHGLATARGAEDADGVCAVAVAWASKVDPAEGEALLAEAEALAANGSADPWTLANAWRAIGNEAGAARVLDVALRGATTSAAASRVPRRSPPTGTRAHAWPRLTSCSSPTRPRPIVSDLAASAPRSSARMRRRTRTPPRGRAPRAASSTCSAGVRRTRGSRASRQRTTDTTDRSTSPRSVRS